MEAALPHSSSQRHCRAQFASVPTSRSMHRWWAPLRNITKGYNLTKRWDGRNIGCRTPSYTAAPIFIENSTKQVLCYRQCHLLLSWMASDLTVNASLLWEAFGLSGPERGSAVQQVSLVFTLSSPAPRPTFFSQINTASTATPCFKICPSIHPWHSLSYW